MGIIKLNGKEYGGSKEISAIKDLTDVSLNDLANGQILKYNTATQKWENSDESGDTPNVQLFEALTYTEVKASSVVSPFTITNNTLTSISSSMTNSETNILSTSTFDLTDINIIEVIVDSATFYQGGNWNGFFYVCDDDTGIRNDTYPSVAHKIMFSNTSTPLKYSLDVSQLNGRWFIGVCTGGHTNLVVNAVAIGSGLTGHVIIDKNNTDMNKRSGLQFTGNVTVTDDSTNDKTVVNIQGININDITASNDTTYSSNKINALLDNKVGTYKVMPSNETLLAMSNHTIFHTEGFYTKGDGNGGYYEVTTSYVRGSLCIKNESPKKFLVALGENGQQNPAEINVCRYGVKPLPYSTEINFSTINATDSFATLNSSIINNIYNPVYGSTFVFPTGRFVFAESIDLNGEQCSIKGADLPQVRSSNQINANYIGGTTLYFPFLNNEENGIKVSFGNVENVTVVGNLNTYDFSIDRTKTITAPNQVVTEVIKKVDNTPVECFGVYKTGQGYIRNVMVMGFYTGIRTSTANVYIDNIYAMKCHLGFSLGGDNKCTNAFGWNVHTLLSVRASLTSVSNIRVDNCVNAINLEHGNGITISDLDGDYCTESLITIGSPETWKEVKDSMLTGIRGRCCTLKSFDSTQATSPDVRELADTAGYGIIRLYRGAFSACIIDFANISEKNPFDETSDYKTPNIIFTYNPSYSINLKGNFFRVADGGITSAIDLKKRFQTQAGVHARFDNYTNIYMIDGTDMYDFKTDIINSLSELLPQAESQEV